MNNPFNNLFRRKINEQIINNSDQIKIEEEIKDIQELNKKNIENNNLNLNENNQDKNFKMLKLSEIEIDSEFSKAFDVKDEVKEKIKKSMQETGYDKSQPIVVWENDENKYIIVDGHTRRKAALELGMDEIPVFIMQFDSREDAHFYTHKRQVERRNLSQKELMKAIELQPKKMARDGSGRADEKLAQELGVSTSTITHANFVMKNASDDDKEDIKNEKKTINQVYNEIKNIKKKNINIIENENQIEENEKIKNKQNMEEQKKISYKKSNKNKITVDEIISLLIDNKENKSLELIIEKFTDRLNNKMINEYFEKVVDIKNKN